MLEEFSHKRFNDTELHVKNRIWRILCKHFFQKYISESDAVLDLGAGYCEFINNIKCSKKYALDIDKIVLEHAEKGVVKLVNKSSAIDLKDESMDVVFASNALEHLENKEELVKTFQEVSRILKQGGKFIILSPNIRFLHDKFWDFIDHKIPISDISISEVLEFVNIKLLEIEPKFLPYTTKSKFPKHDIFIRIYLKSRILQWLFGRQFFIIGEK